MFKRFALGAVVTFVLALLVWGYGLYQYRQGVADEKLAARLLQADIEKGLQYEKDKADARYRAAVAARDVASADLDSVQRELTRVLQNLRDAEAANASDRLNAASSARLQGFAECVREYGNMARDASKWADQVNGLQDFIRGLGVK